jgi:small conductance mechanosensitive channel
MTNTPNTENTIPAINVETIQNLKNVDVAKGWEHFQTYMMDFGIDWGLKLLTAILILIVGWMVGNWIDRRFDSMKRLDDTLKNFLGGFFKYTIIFLSIITVIGVFGIPMASLLAVLGAAGLAIGLALQGTLSNVASGVMLLILRPFNVGDYIEFGLQGGTVKTLGLFGTELATADNVYVFAPNSKIWGAEIKNFSRNMIRRQDILVSISYKDDINKAFTIIDRVLASDERISQIEDKKPITVVDFMGDFSINIIVRFWAQTSDYWDLRWDMTKRLKEELEREGITIPFPTRTVEVVGDVENLSPAQKRGIVG